MKTVNMHEAKTHLSRLVEEAAAGEDIIIARAGKPLVRLVAIAGQESPRQLGRLAGQVTERSDAWARDSELEELMYGGEIEPARMKRVAEPASATPPKRSRKKS